MSLLISANKNIHRFDDTVLPQFSQTGITGQTRWYVKNRVYSSDNPFIFNIKNQTDLIDIELRDALSDTWSLGSGITKNSNNTFVNSNATGYNGAHSSVINSGNCSIEMQANASSGTIWVSLQSDENKSFGFYFTPEMEYVLVFGQGQTIGIYEKGEPKQLRIKATWSNQDKGMVECVNGIIRYWLIKAVTNEMVLLRSTRLSVSYPLVATIGLYFQNASVDKVFVWRGSEVKTQLSSYAVLSSDYQDWQNEGLYESLAEKTMNKDKKETCTYYTDEKQVMTLSLNLEWRFEDEYLAFLEFFKYHDLDKEFIFKDSARRYGQPKEMFAKFISAFKDKPLGGSLFGIQTDIRQEINQKNFLLNQ